VKVEYVEETSVRKALVFEVEPEVVDKEIETLVKQFSRKVKLKGFRPGKIPMEVVKQRYLSRVLEEVAELIVNRVVFEELEGRGLRPLASPSIQDLKIDEHEPLTFRAVFETLPLVDVPEYKGLAVTARPAQVSEEQVTREIDEMREEAARYDPVEGRAAASGDFVLLDVTWVSKEGEPRRDENLLLEVGAQANHADLNAALDGMSPGETKQVRLVFEDEPGSPDVPQLVGPGGTGVRVVDYTVTVKAVKTRIVPVADDEFAKDLGDFGSLAELRESVSKRLLAIEERKIDGELKGALVEALVEKADFEVPEALVEHHMNARTEGALRDLALQGIDPTKVGVDWTQYRQAQREEALKAAKADILLGEISRREGLEVSDAEVDAEISRYAERVKKPKESVLRQMEKEGSLARLRGRIREEKTLDLLKANARLDFE
jgi:trigger factor